MPTVLVSLSCFAAGIGLGVVVERYRRRWLRARRSLRFHRKRLDGPRAGLAFYVVPAELGDPSEIVAGLTGYRRPRLCLIGRLCGPLVSGDGPVPESGLQRGALWIAPGLLIFHPLLSGAEVSVLEAPYGVDVRESMVTEAGTRTVTLDLGDGLLAFEPSPDTDASHAWSRIQSVLESAN